MRDVGNTEKRQLCRANHSAAAQAGGDPQGHEFRADRRRQFAGRLRGVFVRAHIRDRALAGRTARSHRGQCGGLDGRRVRLLCDEFLCHLRGGIRPEIALEVIFRLRGRGHSRRHRQYGDARGRGRLHAGRRSESPRHRRRLPGQFLDVAFRGVPAEAKTKTGVMVKVPLSASRRAGSRARTRNRARRQTPSRHRSRAGNSTSRKSAPAGNAASACRRRSVRRTA